MIRGKFNSFFQKKRGKIILGIVGLLFIGVIYGIGNSSATLELNGDKVTYDELQGKLADVEANIETKEKEFSTLDEKFKERENEVNEVLALVDEKEEVSTKVDGVKGELTDTEKKLKSVSEELGEKKNELEKVESAIVKKKEEPTQLLSGVYIVGIDVSEGRYQVTNVGRGSNFFVYDSSGSGKVNTILGDSRVGSGDYIFFANDGDLIETNGEVKLIPVE